jgi:hypothetical protein
MHIANGMLALGASEDEAIELCRLVALDSMPQERRVVLETLRSGEALLATEIARRSHAIFSRSLQVTRSVGSFIHVPTYMCA